MSLFEVQQFSPEVGNTFIPKDDMEIFPVDLDGKICPQELQPQRKTDFKA